MLVVFKSAPILKRVLKVKHDLLQLYVLKVRIFYVTGLLKASNSCCFRANLLLMSAYAYALVITSRPPQDNAK